MGKTKNFVAQLKKQARKARWELKYEDECSEEPEPNKRFFTRAVVNGQSFPFCVGNNPMEAKQNAAKSALRGLREKENPKPVTEKAAKVPQKTATKVLGVLNENVPKDRVNIKAGQSTRREPHDAPQCSSFVVGDKGHPAVPGKPMKEAKEEAAKLERYATFFSRTTETSSGNDDVAAARPPTTLASCDAKSKGVPMTDFTNSSRPTEDEEQDPVVRPKTRFTSDFDCIENMGEGTYGQVFKAIEKLTGKNHAIKIVQCGDIEKALPEVKTLIKLLHENIVRYFTCWLEDSGYSPDESGSSTQRSINPSIRYLYIQLELCDYTLRVWIDEKNEEKSLRDSKRREEALTKFQQIVRGVEYIHSKMLIHRDLKPANIMIGQDGQVKIVDFGMVTYDNDAENLRERLYKGTRSYMAPEQKRQKTYDRKVDIFPLGLIYFELLWKMPTGHERAVVLTDLREQTFPKEFQHNFYQEYLVIKPMLCEKPEQRPEASQLNAVLKKISDSFDIEEMQRRGSRSI
ncbi:interferon-induced, double-stranded RNA-activated protein kinase-like isoform X2 [Trematomus bernacchii]|uniref:interferon-induced, double-stranded RNA-activated protein kinase-like isoform X2 n=1 Tax=Trematomus bernacchii TaxID=40690 RepID=UPI00146AD4C2|nr:interferon-induced, double-stranded RNA-activated protein kinase-like isoform X2 [Trematomus bernacchii]